MAIEKDRIFTRSMGRASREVWIELIERWRDSGLGAKEFSGHASERWMSLPVHAGSEENRYTTLS